MILLISLPYDIIITTKKKKLGNIGYTFKKIEIIFF